MKFNMGIKTVCLVVLAIVVMSLHQTEASPELKKLALIKAKLALKKAPHIIAKVAVAKEVKTKTKIAAAKTIAAIKASKIAALSALTAPFRVVKKTVALKIAGLKAAKALKIAKLAKAAQIVAHLKKSPIILPVPIAVPAKDLKSVGLKAGLGAGIGASLGADLPAAAAASIGAVLPSLGAALPSLGGEAGTSFNNPLTTLFTSAQRAVQTAGAAGVPILSRLAGGLGLGLGGSASERVEKEIEPPVAPTYRFVPEVGFSNYNQVQYQPNVEVEVPSAPIIVR